MRTLILVAVVVLALGITGAGRLSLALGDGKLALGAHVGDVGMALHIKFDL